MSTVLGRNSYGKSRVRLVKVTRRADRHDICDLTVDVALEGDFAAAHTAGRQHRPARDRHDAQHRLRARPGPRRRRRPRALRHPPGRALPRRGPDGHAARGCASPPTRGRGCTAGGAPDPHAFQRGNGGDRVATVAGDAAGVSVEAGIDGLVVLKTTGSGWEGYHRDEYTSLAETDDRIMATEVTARWTYRAAPGDRLHAPRGRPSATSSSRRSATTTARRCSSRCTGWATRCWRPGRRCERISFSLPNKHHLLFDLDALRPRERQRDLPADDEPYGLIEGTVERAPVAGSATRVSAGLRGPTPPPARSSAASAR